MSIFDSLRKRSQKGWATRKARPEYQSDEQKQARRESSRKSYATRMGLMYSPEIVPKYGAAKFIAEHFEPSSAVLETNLLRDEIQAATKSATKGIKSPYVRQVISQSIVEERVASWKREYAEERLTFEAYDLTYEPSWSDLYYPDASQKRKAKQQIKELLGNEDLTQGVLEAALDEFNEKMPNKSFSEYASEYANDYYNQALKPQLKAEAENILRYNIYELFEHSTGGRMSYEEFINYLYSKFKYFTKYEIEKIYADEREKYFAPPKGLDRRMTEEPDDHQYYIGQDSTYYDVDEYDGSDLGDTDEDNILYRIEQMLNDFNASALNVTEDLQKIKQADKNLVQSVLEGAIARDGRLAVARRLASVGDSIISTLSDVLSTSGDAVVTLEINTGKHTGIGTKVVEFNNIVNGGALTNEESEYYTQISESMNEGE